MVVVRVAFVATVAVSTPIMSRTLVYVPTTRPTTPIIIKKIFFRIVKTVSLSLYETQISISAGHTIPNTDIHNAPTRLINNPMRGIATANATIQWNVISLIKIILYFNS